MRMRFAVCLVLCVASAPCRAATLYYVAPNGSKRNDGSARRPFATIQEAAARVFPGDTVIVKDGVYHSAEGDDCCVIVDRSGTPEKPITFRAEHKWGAVLDGKNYTTGFGWDFGKYASHIIVEGFELKSFLRGGFWDNSGAHHIAMRGNHVHHIGNVETTTDQGEDGAFDGSLARYIVYDGNVFHDIGRTGPPTENFNHDHAIYSCGKHLIITNNVFYDCNAGCGLNLAGYKTVDDVVVSNNVFAFGYKRGHVVLWMPCHNVLIQNNIFYRPAVANAINFSSDDLQNVTIRNNLVFGGGLKGDDKGACKVVGNLIGDDPMFVNAQDHDFRLKPGSPAIGAGIAERARRQTWRVNRAPWAMAATSARMSNEK